MGRRLLLLGLLLSLPGMLPACWVAGPGPHGEGGHAMTAAEAQQLRDGIVITEESAVIIWDEARKVEHFIRQADIRTSAPDVGFVVPTPETPELAEADPMIFVLAEKMAQPQPVPPVIYETPLEAMNPFKPRPPYRFTRINATLAMVANGSGVRVVQEQEVAGYHAVTLAADDVAALSHWLQENGYTSSPAVEAWLQPYIARKWKITAFKLVRTAKETKTGSLHAKAIRMTFPTERPFFPYSEPGNTAGQAAAGAGKSQRHLNVAILSQKRMAGTLQDGHAWPGELQYAGTSTPAPATQGNAAQWLTFAGLDNAKDKPEVPPWLACFQDDANPRPGTSDLVFSSSADPAPFQRTFVDENLWIEYRVDWSHPLENLKAGLVALLILGLLAAYPVYLYRLSKSMPA